MRRIIVPVVMTLFCLMSWQHDPADAGWKGFKHRHASCAGCAAPVGCYAPFGCAAPGCYAPGCYAPAFHRPFAPLVAHYGYGGAPGCFAPHCGMACAAPLMPGCACSMPGYGMPLGGYDGGFENTVDLSQPGFDIANEMPLLSGTQNYYAPMGPMAAPIPAVPPVEDVVW